MIVRPPSHGITRLAKARKRVGLARSSGFIGEDSLAARLIGPKTRWRQDSLAPRLVGAKTRWRQDSLAARLVGPKTHRPEVRPPRGRNLPHPRVAIP